MTTDAVGAYISECPAEAHQTLTDLRECLRASAPDAAEVIKWGHPSYEDGTILFAFAGFAKHANFYCTPSTISAFAEELAPFGSGKSSVKCPYDRPIPGDLLNRMAAYRIREYEEDGIGWM